MRRLIAGCLIVSLAGCASLPPVALKIAPLIPPAVRGAVKAIKDRRAKQREQEQAVPVLPIVPQPELVPIPDPRFTPDGWTQTDGT